MIKKILEHCEGISIYKTRIGYRACLNDLAYKKGWAYQQSFVEASSLDELLEKCLEEVDRSYK